MTLVRQCGIPTACLLRSLIDKIELKKDIRKYIVGDFLNDKERIIEFDMDKHFIKTVNDGYRYETNYIYIENMDVKPNVYNDYNPYYGL